MSVSDFRRHGEAGGGERPKADDGSCEKGLLTPEEARDGERRGDVELRGYEGGGEPGLSLLWLSGLPPDRPARACNQAENADSQITRQIKSSIYNLFTIHHILAT